MPTQDIDAMTRVITVTDINADVADAMTCLIYMHLLFSLLLTLLQFYLNK